MNFPVQGKNSWSAKSFASHGTDPGVDIFAAKGTPVVAVYDGEIDRNSYGPSLIGGNRVWLKTSHGSFYYAHLSVISVTRGQKVSAGQVIGAVGDTGNARGTSPHLHFGLSLTGPGGRWSDPTALLGGGGSTTTAPPAVPQSAPAPADLAQAGPAGAVLSYLDTTVVQPFKAIAERLLLILIGVALLIVAFREPIADVAGRFTGAAAKAAVA